MSIFKNNDYNHLKPGVFSYLNQQLQLSVIQQQHLAQPALSHLPRKQNMKFKMKIEGYSLSNGKMTLSIGNIFTVMTGQ